MKKFVFTATLIFLLHIVAHSYPTLSFSFPYDNNVINLNTPGPFPNGSIYHIATVGSDASASSVDKYTHLKVDLTWTSVFVFNTGLPKFWVFRRGNPNASFALTPIYQGTTSFEGDIAPSNNAPDDYYDIYMEIKSAQDYANCNAITFTLTGTKPGTAISYGSASSTIYFSRYTSTEAERTTPDLFVKDNALDVGYEPNWQATTAQITRSVSILNDRFNVTPRTYNGLNPTLTLSNFAQRSTLGNLNKMNVWIENRGCVATTSSATMNLHWTIARLWEPWGQDWHNYNQYGFASNNFVSWRNPANGGIAEPKPMGNHITLSNPFDYESGVQTVTIPSGVLPSTANTGGYYGGYLATVDWNPPHSDWYNSAAIFRDNARPVLCYLAIINEPDKANDGFYSQYPANSGTSITDYALYNNNVATVNSFLATPTALYKRQITDTKFRSDIGTIIIDNPNGLPYINISIVPDDNQPDFSNNGTVYLYFDEFLWDRLSTNGLEGSGFEVVSEQVIKITGENNLATLTNIQLNDGDRGMIGLMFEYDSDKAPSEDYIYGVSVGAFDEDPQVQIGSPTYFNTHVLSVPALEEGEGEEYFLGNKELIGKMDFVSLHPNPVVSDLNLGFNLSENASTIKIEIFDLQLKRVYTKEQNNVNKGAQAIKINAESFSEGTYLLKLSVDGSYKTIKFVK